MALEAPSDEPPDVVFNASLVGDKTTFESGELIQVKLEFHTQKPETYRLDKATYDRSGRLHSDIYNVAPSAGTYDPLASYFSNGLYGMGGIRAMPVLGTEPETIVRDVNEYVGFSKPGTYQLTVHSTRIESDAPANSDSTSMHHTVVAKPLQVTILPPNPSWQTKTLNDALKTLDAKGSEEEKTKAARIVRFLNSKDAVIAMVQRLTPNNHSINFQFQFGLYGTSHRKLAIDTLAKRLEQPDQPLSQNMFHTLMRLESLRATPEPLPPYPSNEKAREAWQERSKERRALHTKLRDKRAAHFVTTLDSKTSSARAITLTTLLDSAWSHPSGTLPSWFDPLRSELGSVLAELPPTVLQPILEYRWRRIKDPALLPALTLLVDRLPKTQHWLRYVAIGRILELDPQQGQARIHAMVNGSKPIPYSPNAIDVLSRLPNAQIPEFDAVLLRRLEHAASPQGHSEQLGLVLRLIERYASPAIASSVEKVYRDLGTNLATRPHASMLAYLIRANPAQGARLLDALLHEPETTQMRYANLLPEIGALHPNEAIERQAAALLKHENPNVVIKAVETLGKYGSPRAEKLLWTMFETWNARWKGRQEELRYTVGRENPNRVQVQLESALWRSIAHGHNWNMTPQKLNKMVNLCVSTQEKGQARYTLDGWGSQLSMSLLFNDSGQLTARVAHYDRGLDTVERLKERLARFPAGTTFRLDGNPVDDDPTRQQLIADLKVFLGERGLELQ